MLVLSHSCFSAVMIKSYPSGIECPKILWNLPYHSCRKVIRWFPRNVTWGLSEPHTCIHTQKKLSLVTMPNTIYLKDAVNQKKKQLVLKSSKGCTCRFPQLSEFIVAVVTGYIPFSVGTKHLTYSQRTIAEVCCVCVLLCGPSCL